MAILSLAVQQVEMLIRILIAIILLYFSLHNILNRNRNHYVNSRNEYLKYKWKTVRRVKQKQAMLESNLPELTYSENKRG